MKNKFIYNLLICSFFISFLYYVKYWSYFHKKIYIESKHRFFKVTLCTCTLFSLWPNPTNTSHPFPIPILPFYFRVFMHFDARMVSNSFSVFLFYIFFCRFKGFLWTFHNGTFSNVWVVNSVTCVLIFSWLWQNVRTINTRFFSFTKGWNTSFVNTSISLEFK